MTTRAEQKQRRRSQLVEVAAALFAERGFHAVSIDDVGAAAGVRGPALYRHFAGKNALLQEILVGASERLLAGGRAEVERGGAPAAVLDRLIAFHAAFAFRDRDVIRVQERDDSSLDVAALGAMRDLQRRYVELWVGVLADLHAGVPEDELRVRAHAVFGLINSTPHSARLHDLRRNRQIVEDLAAAAARTPVDPG
jgi:AcrR family transcriptional regulator